MYYCEQHRPALLEKEKKKGQKINIGNIAKALGKSWKNLVIKASGTLALKMNAMRRKLLNTMKRMDFNLIKNK